MADGVERGRAFLVHAYRQAQLLGHQLELENYGQGLVKWRCRCTCGYSSTARRSQAMALGAAMHHAGKVYGDYQRNGGPPIPDTPEDAEIPPVKIAGL